MNDDSFIRRVRSDPSDDAAWLVYADWLEERGDSRSEILRILCLVGTPSCLEYYPDQRKRVDVLRGTVDSGWLETVFQVRELVDRSKPPHPAQLDAIWQETGITPAAKAVGDQAEAVRELLDRLDKCMVDGRTLFARIKLSPHPVLAWYASQDRWAEIQFFQRLLRSPVVWTLLPKLGRAENSRLPEGFVAEITGEGCAYGKTVELPAQMAGTIPSGLWSFGPRAAASVRAATERWCRSLFGEKPAGGRFCFSAESWALWFYGCYSFTWLVIDQTTWEVAILCAAEECP